MTRVKCSCRGIATNQMQNNRRMKWLAAGWETISALTGTGPYIKRYNRAEN